MTWFHTLSSFFRRRRRSDDLTLTLCAPHGATIRSNTIVKYINGEKVFVQNQTIVETSTIGQQADCGSGQHTEKIEDSTAERASITSTLVANAETETETEPVSSTLSCKSNESITTELDHDNTFITPLFVDKSTGRRMLEIINRVCLDDCVIKSRENIQPTSDEYMIELVLQYKNYKFWAQVPYGVVKDRDDFKACSVDVGMIFG